MSDQPKRDVMYNQAGGSTERINEIYKRIDECSIDLFALSIYGGIGKRNYEVVVSDLNSLFCAISNKCDKKEKESIAGMRIQIRKTIRSNPPFLNKVKATYGSSKKESYENIPNQDLIADMIQEYRLLVEDAMENHGFSNPNKEDVTKSAVKF